MRPPAAHRPSTTVVRFFSASSAVHRHIFDAAGDHLPIQSLSSAGRLRDALRLLILRRHLGRPVGPDCFASILKPCASSPQDVHIARLLHAHMLVTGFAHDPFVCNHLINAYGNSGLLEDASWVFRSLRKKKLHSWNTLISGFCKFGFLHEARRLFDEMPLKDAVSWNTMIAGYDQWGPCEEALMVFNSMMRSGCKIDHFGLSSALSSSANIRFQQNGKGLHGLSAKVGLNSHLQVGSAVVELYAKCALLDDARSFFDAMSVKEQLTWNSMLCGYVQCSSIGNALAFFQDMPEKNVVSWTTIIVGCSQHDRNEQAIFFFWKMQEAGLKPDHVSFINVLDACEGLLDLEEGCKIHSQIVKSGFGVDVFVGSALVALYAKCRCLTDARRITFDMAVVDDFAWSALIAENAKHGVIDVARELFENVHVKSVTLWNSLIGGYSALELYDEAFRTFKRMQEDGKVGDEFTFGSLLLGADHLGLTYIEQLHAYIVKVGADSSSSVGSSLINMYNANLDFEAAVRVFNFIEEPSLTILSSMIHVYVQNNLTKEAIHTFRLMIAVGIQPDSIALSLVLKPCTLHGGRQVHALACKLGCGSSVTVGNALIDMYAKNGNIDCAVRAFNSINRHNIVSWTVLVGGYMRCGNYDAAKRFFYMMPEHNVVSWNTMLSGYAKHGFPSQVFQQYNQMTKTCTVPDEISFTILLTVCGNFLLEENGKQVHGQIIKYGYSSNAQIKSSLHGMYQKLGQSFGEKELCSASVDPEVLDGQETNTISENIKLLESVYFSSFEMTDFQNKAH